MHLCGRMFDTRSQYRIGNSRCWHLDWVITREGGSCLPISVTSATLEIEELHSANFSVALQETIPKTLNPFLYHRFSVFLPEQSVVIYVKMGRRGPRSKLTDDMIERVKEQYRNGVAHRTIAAEVGISETNIRRIIGMHGIPKRGRKLATLLSPQEEDGLVRYLSTFGPFRGKYRTLRTAMEQFAQENSKISQISITVFFSYA